MVYKNPDGINLDTKNRERKKLNDTNLEFQIIISIIFWAVEKWSAKM